MNLEGALARKAGAFDYPFWLTHSRATDLQQLLGDGKVCFGGHHQRRPAFEVFVIIIIISIMIIMIIMMIIIVISCVVMCSLRFDATFGFIIVCVFVFSPAFEVLGVWVGQRPDELQADLEVALLFYAMLCYAMLCYAIL